MSNHGIKPQVAGKSNRMTELYWLPEAPDWSGQLKALPASGDHTLWQALVHLADKRLDFTKTERLARTVGRLCGTTPPDGLATAPVRLAVLGSSTVEHLISGIRIAGVRRNMWIDIYTGPYGQYLQELADHGSALHQFRPDTVLFALDARHLIGPAARAQAREADAALERLLDRLAEAWSKARALGADVLQQTALPVFPRLLGAHDHRLAWSPHRLVGEFNARLRGRADAAGIDLLDLSGGMHHGGLADVHDPLFWLSAKQEISPKAAPFYGDLVGRLLAARRGRSAKCLVLDLDNTLWGGVIGDDGLDGILLGQGSTVGEAHLAVQAYALDLSRRGIILAICSKNDEANAIEAFERHPDMLLRRSDIACFSANWNDKPANLRSIAGQLNIGLDALVFVDDNPFERNIVRRELPAVRVPELPEDPAYYVGCLSDAGYFEATEVTAEDLERSMHYQGNLQRQSTKAAATDIAGYLESLCMKMPWQRFDDLGLARIVQLINKSNQFNLTTQRYTPADISALMHDKTALCLQLRLSDIFGDNGMIAVIICRPGVGPETMQIDTWLMSCRVLGRGVEEASMNLLAEQARQANISMLRGRYIPTPKNTMVADHYSKLGFDLIGRGEDGSTEWQLDLSRFTPFATSIEIIHDHPD